MTITPTATETPGLDVPLVLPVPGLPDTVLALARSADGSAPVCAISISGYCLDAWLVPRARLSP